MSYTDLVYDSKHDLKLRLRMPDAENPPLFIYFHGGGIQNGSRTGEAVMLQGLADDGIATASVDYRLYPNAKFPEFIEDCAAAVDFLLNKYETSFSRVYIGGSSAGSYLSMMLFFDKTYLGKYGIDPMKLDGYVFDAGQPTTHFNVMVERGFDHRVVRIDDAAPLYYLTEDFKGDRFPQILSLASSNDIPCRVEQIKLLHATMRDFHYPENRLRFLYMDGHSHCDYVNTHEFKKIVESVVLPD